LRHHNSFERKESSAIAQQERKGTNEFGFFTDRKDSGVATTHLMAHFNLEPKVTLVTESSTSSGIANDKDEDNLNNE